MKCKKCIKGELLHMINVVSDDRNERIGSVYICDYCDKTTLIKCDLDHAKDGGKE